MEIDLSLVITGHREGVVAGTTVASARDAIYYAARCHVAMEVVVVLDRADAITSAALGGGFSDINDCPLTVLLTDAGDPGRARNEGVRSAKGRLVAILDADDLVSQNWFAAAATMAKQRPDAILHPAASVSFGHESLIWWHVDSESSLFDPLYMEWSNYWSPITCARRETYLRHPFKANLLKDGFGHEDWHWNRKTLAGGVPHKPVPDTAYFYRRRTGSQMAHVAAANGTSWPLRKPRPPRPASLRMGRSENGKGNFDDS